MTMDESDLDGTWVHPPNTLYVTEDDVLIVPGGAPDGWAKVEEQLGCDVVVGTQATEPWAIRKIDYPHNFPEADDFDQLDIGH